jgi:hypothetical protein
MENDFDYVELPLLLVIEQVTCHLSKPKGKMKITIEHTNKSHACEAHGQTCKGWQCIVKSEI